SPGDGWLIAEIARAHPPMWASSSWNDAERAHFSTDFDVFSRTGLVGVEFANPPDGARHHTPRDTVGAVNASLVQSDGDTVMTLVRHLGRLDLTAVHRTDDDNFVT